MSFTPDIDLNIFEINTSILNSTMAKLCSMPNPHNKGTLHFKGKDIDVFLSKFEFYADHADLTKFQRCDFICLYFSKKERKVLDILEGFQCHNWGKLKEELWSLYSSSCTSCSISSYPELKYDLEVKYVFAGHEANGSQASGSQLYAISEFRSSAGLCNMCGELPHDIVDCQETKFLMFLGICDMDRDSQVVMRDGSAVPLAEGEGGVAQVICKQEAAATKLDAFPSVEETEPKVLTSEMSDCAGSSDYGDSSTYDYMNGVEEFENSALAKEKEEMCQHSRWGQLRHELQTLYSSGSESEPEHLDSKLEHSQEYKLEIAGSVYGNPPFWSQPQVTPDFEPLNLCTIDQVLDSSVLPQVEGKEV